MEGELLEQWAINAASHPDDWYSAAQHYYTALRFQQALAERRRRRRFRRRPAVQRIIFVEGPTGAGKNMIINHYLSLMAWFYGIEIYHVGCLGYGRMLQPEEWYTCFNFTKIESAVFIDESASVNRKGRDNADIQGIQNEGSTTIRKQRLEVFHASARGPSGSGLGLRESIDEMWRPEKLEVRFSREEQERREGIAIPPFADPANFHYAYLYTDEKPFPAESAFDRIIGRSDVDLKNLPIYRKHLDAKWMCQVNPLLDSFYEVPVGVATRVKRADVTALAGGDGSVLNHNAQRAQRGQAQGTLVKRGAATAYQFWVEISNLNRAFREGRLDLPPQYDDDQDPPRQFLAAHTVAVATRSELSTAKIRGVSHRRPGPGQSIPPRLHPAGPLSCDDRIHRVLQRPPQRGPRVGGHSRPRMAAGLTAVPPGNRNRAPIETGSLRCYARPAVHGVTSDHVAPSAIRSPRQPAGRRRPRPGQRRRAAGICRPSARRRPSIGGAGVLADAGSRHPNAHRGRGGY